MSGNAAFALAELAAFEASVAGHVKWIHESAIAAPPGGNNVWDRVLAHYGAAPDAALTRLEEAQKAGQSRGATLREVRRAVEAMAASAQAEFARITSSFDQANVDLASRMGALRGWLSRLADEEMARYAAIVSTPKAAVAASVGNVFANAQSTAKKTPWANLKIDPANVLQCAACGAPQERALDFTCRYCRSPMMEGIS